MSNEPGGLSPKPIQGAYAALVLLFIINMVNYVDRYLLAAVAPEACKTIFPAEMPEGTQMEYMGMLQGVFMVAYLVAAPFFGWLSDRYSRWTIVTIGLVVWSIATGLSGMADSFWTMFACRCLVGVGEAAYAPAAPAILADLFPVKIRNRAITTFYIAIPVGSAMGFVYGGQMQAAFGWQHAFYWMTIPGIVLAVLCLFMREPKRGESDGEDYQPSTQPRMQNYLRILKNKSFLYCCLGMAAMTFAVGGITTWMPTYVSIKLQQEDPAIIELAKQDQNQADKQSLKQANDTFGPIVAVGTLISTILGGILADWMRSRVRGSYFVLSGVSMILGFGFFIAFLYSSFPMAWVFMFLTVFFVFANTGPTNTILANVVHPAMRQMAVALCIVIIHIFGDVPSPWIISAVSGGKAHLFRGFILVSIFILISGIIWWMGARHLEQDTANSHKMMDDEKQS